MNLRNVAIIAHVDHGKTTLVDALLQQSGVFRANQEHRERIMDSNELERERGITILAKNTAIHYHDTKINIVDTPGHADFGGEVERALKMVDGVLLLVDASEGPLPQTRYVLRKALEARLPPVVVINKIDRSDARAGEVLNEVYDLFIDLDATEDQLDFPVLYTNAKAGIAKTSADGPGEDLRPLFEALVNHVPAPPGSADGVLQLLIANLDYSDYLGRLAIGRVFSGRVRVGDTVAVAKRDGRLETTRVTKLYVFDGLKRIEADEAPCGEIVALAGFEGIQIGETVTSATDPGAAARRCTSTSRRSRWCSRSTPRPSPAATGAGSPRATSRTGWRRSCSRTSRSASSRRSRRSRSRCSAAASCSSRSSSRPCAARASSSASRTPRSSPTSRTACARSRSSCSASTCPRPTWASCSRRWPCARARCRRWSTTAPAACAWSSWCPTRGLIGIRTELLTDTRGTAVMNALLEGWVEWQGEIPRRQTGVLVADRSGDTTAYALSHMEDRGELFVGPGAAVYEGMLVGENARPDDMDVNVTKQKKLTNMRASTADEAIRLTPHRQLNLEQALEFIAQDELVEVTPTAIRLRKRTLVANQRTKWKKQE